MTVHDFEAEIRRHEAADRADLEPEFQAKHDVGLWFVVMSIAAAICSSVWLAFLIWGIN